MFFWSFLINRIAYCRGNVFSKGKSFWFSVRPFEERFVYKLFQVSTAVNHLIFEFLLQKQSYPVLASCVFKNNRRGFVVSSKKRKLLLFSSLAKLKSLFSRIAHYFKISYARTRENATSYSVAGTTARVFVA